MNDPMLMQATIHHDDLLREAERARLAARARRARRRPHRRPARTTPSTNAAISTTMTGEHAGGAR
jgi:hypothetical protein